VIDVLLAILPGKPAARQTPVLTCLPTFAAVTAAEKQRGGVGIAVSLS